jgi:hypothetical protein
MLEQLKKVLEKLLVPQRPVPVRVPARAPRRMR